MKNLSRITKNAANYWQYSPQSEKIQDNVFRLLSTLVHFMNFNLL